MPVFAPGIDGSTISLVHTWEMQQFERTAVRNLLDDAFDGEFGDEDWEHSLGGLHALAWMGDELIGHGALVQRQLIHSGRVDGRQITRTLRAGYLEGMAVRQSRRGQGIGRALMKALNDVVRAAYPIGALSAADDARKLYEGTGWLPWRGRTFALTPEGLRRTELEDDGILVLPLVPVDLSGDLTCDWRDGDLW